MDILPTLAALAGAPTPTKTIDGHDIRPLILGAAGAHSPWDETGFGFYRMDQLQAIRADRWKLYLPLDRKLGNQGRKPAVAQAQLYDVVGDVAETQEVFAEHPEVVRRLTAMADRLRTEVGDLDSPGAGQRAAGWVDTPRPLLPNSGGAN
jgi:arylsulfatase A-like enzyme